jgi:hypothetical protein
MEGFPFPLSAEGGAQREAQPNTRAFASHEALGRLAWPDERAIDQLRQHAKHDGADESG